MVWIILGFAALIATYVLYLYVRVFIKRIILYLKLKAAAKKLQFKIIPTRAFWIFGRERGKNCDFYIETTHYVYSIKLMASLRKRTQYKFLSEDTVIKEYDYWITGHWTLPFVLHTSKKVITLSKINFRYRYSDSGLPQKFMQMFLFCPVPSGISFIPDKFLSTAGERKSDYMQNVLKGLAKTGEENREFSEFNFMQNSGDGEILYNKYLVCGTVGLMRKIINDVY